MYIFLKTTHRDEFNGISHARPNFEKMTPAREPILDLRVPIKWVMSLSLLFAKNLMVQLSWFYLINKEFGL